MSNSQHDFRALRFCKPVLLLALSASFSKPLRADDAEETRMPASMGSLGDSMTAGALAMFKRQDFVLPWTEFMVALRAIAFGLTNKLSTVESRKLSWAAGYDTARRVESHSYRLTQIQHLKKQIPTYNAAISGAESEHVLATQVDRLSEWSLKTVKKPFPDYVTLMIGPNDACADSTDQMVDTNTYYSNVSKVIDEMLARSPDTKIVVGSIPNIETLRGVAKDARLYWGISCGELWEKTKLCPTLTTLSDPYQRAIVAARIQDYNSALQQIVETRRADFGDRIRFAEQTYKEVFTANELSIDCFHPNSHGQDRIANATWNASWWTKEWTKRRAEIVAEEKRKKEQRCRLSQRGGRGATPVPGC
jgi:lysophospholipase L1-like esterase